MATLREPHNTGSVPSGEQVRAWKPPIACIQEVFHARFIEHAYPPHTHDDWTVFIVDDGAIRYDLDRHHRGAETTMVSILPPGVVHDGRSATNHGFHKRVLYLDADLLGEDLIGQSVDRPAVVDPELRHDLSVLHSRLAQADDWLEAETRLGLVAERLRQIFGRPVPDATQAPEPAEILAERLRAYFDAHLFETVTLASAGTLIGANPTHLARCFSSTFGIAPHTYVTGRRIEAARRQVLDGQPLAQVAIAVGFHDQAHFTRRFKRHLGVSPGRYRKDQSDLMSNPKASRGK